MDVTLLKTSFLGKIENNNKPWYLYKTVAQNMSGTYEVKYFLSEKKIDDVLYVVKCL